MKIIDSFRNTLEFPNLWLAFHWRNNKIIEHFITELCDTIKKEYEYDDLSLNRVTCVIEVKEYPKLDIHLIWVMKSEKTEQIEVDILIKNHEQKGAQHGN